MSAFSDYQHLLGRLRPDEIARSENDLSARLAKVFEELGLHTTLDTSGGTDSRKRPDIAAYVDQGTADLAGPAEVVVECKKPVEIDGDLLEALLRTELWTVKFIPYMLAHLESVQYFVLTTFERFLVVYVNNDLRTRLARGDTSAVLLGPLVRRHSVALDARTANPQWEAWCRSHFGADVLLPSPLSEILDLRSVSTRPELNVFADRLATLVAGHVSAPESAAALIHSVRISAGNVDDLPPAVLASLTVYVMAQHAGMDAATARSFIEQHLEDELNGFVSASVNSLIGRMFAYKIIEDCFCVGETSPLLSSDQYVFHTERYDCQDSPSFLAAVFAAMRNLDHSTPATIQSLARAGAFYDWIETRVDPQAFRRVFYLIATHSFAQLSGDLLGRFFEHYAQRVDRRKRRALGQYYTPSEIVGYMWNRALLLSGDRIHRPNFAVLDPGVGSATFLVEGAYRTANLGVDRFWDRLVGFDIDPQVIGVAYVNLFLAVLSQLSREEAEALPGLRLYPTDALDPSNSGPLEAILPLLTEERLRNFLTTQITLSQEDKSASAYEIVIGNPPYHNNSRRTLAQVAETFPRLLATSRANARARERNIRDDYAWFFAAADHYIRHEGLIAFVVSDSFCRLESYRFFRIDLLRHYRVREIVNLGSGVFEDVGPRISFVIVFLEKREHALGAPSEEPVPYADLRNVASDHRLQMLLSADLDPQTSQLPFEPHVPDQNHGYSLIPAGDVAAAVRNSGPPIAAQRGSRVFVKKWPGLITAFDKLFADTDRERLVARWRHFFSCVSSSRREEDVRSFATDIGADNTELQRLYALANDALSKGLQFSESKIKRAISGSSPNSDRWYPAAGLTTYIYYEPSLSIPRNRNEGKFEGWGTMNQWGVPAAHVVTPKLVFTTGSKPRYGLKAFVLRDEWYVKLHGGTSQQFSYTLLDDPTRAGLLGGLPNNLTPEAEPLYRSFALDTEHDQESFLLFVAGIYNTDVAARFLVQGGGKVMHVPLDDAEAAKDIASASRKLRDLTVLRHALASSIEVDAEMGGYELGYLASVAGMDLEARGGRRYRSQSVLVSTQSTGEMLAAAMDSFQAELDDLVRGIYALP